MTEWYGRDGKIVLGVKEKGDLGGWRIGDFSLSFGGVIRRHHPSSY